MGRWIMWHCLSSPPLYLLRITLLFVLCIMQEITIIYHWYFNNLYMVYIVDIHSGVSQILARHENCVVLNTVIGITTSYLEKKSHTFLYLTKTQAASMFISHYASVTQSKIYSVIARSISPPLSTIYTNSIHLWGRGIRYIWWITWCMECVLWNPVITSSHRSLFMWQFLPFFLSLHFCGQGRNIPRELDQNIPIDVNSNHPCHWPLYWLRKLKRNFPYIWNDFNYLYHSSG